MLPDNFLDEAQRRDLEKFINHPLKSSLDASLMGGGKTRVAVAYIDWVMRNEPGTILILAEKRVIKTAWIPTLKQVGIEPVSLSPGVTSGLKAPESSAAWRRRDHRVFIINPESMGKLGLHKDHEPLALVVADEIHLYGSSTSRASGRGKNLQWIKARRKHGMTGTFAGNVPWAMYYPTRWLFGPDAVQNRGFWDWARLWFVIGSIRTKAYSSDYVIEREKNPGAFFNSLPNVVQHLPFETCCGFHPGGFMADVPQPVVEKIVLDLHPEERRLHDEMDRVMRTRLPSGEVIAAPTVAVAHSRKRSFTLGVPSRADVYYRVNPDTGLDEPTIELLFEGDGISTKLDYIRDWALDNPGVKAIIFTDSAAILERAKVKMDHAGVQYSMHTGLQSDKEKDAAIAKFREDGQLLFASIRATGTGMDGLQHICNRIFFLSLQDGSQTDVEQAIARLYRRGQRKTTTVYVLEGRGTVDADTKLNIDVKKQATDVATRLIK